MPSRAESKKFKPLQVPGEERTRPPPPSLSRGDSWSVDCLYFWPRISNCTVVHSAVGEYVPPAACDVSRLKPQSCQSRATEGAVVESVIDDRRSGAVISSGSQMKLKDSETSSASGSSLIFSAPPAERRFSWVSANSTGNLRTVQKMVGRLRTATRSASRSCARYVPNLGPKMKDDHSLYLRPAHCSSWWPRHRLFSFSFHFFSFAALFESVAVLQFTSPTHPVRRVGGDARIEEWHFCAHAVALRGSVFRTDKQNIVATMAEVLKNFCLDFSRPLSLSISAVCILSRTSQKPSANLTSIASLTYHLTSWKTLEGVSNESTVSNRVLCVTVWAHVWARMCKSHHENDGTADKTLPNGLGTKEGQIIRSSRVISPFTVHTWRARARSGGGFRTTAIARTCVRSRSPPDRYKKPVHSSKSVHTTLTVIMIRPSIAQALHPLLFHRQEEPFSILQSSTAQLTHSYCTTACAIKEARTTVSCLYGHMTRSTTLWLFCSAWVFDS